MPPTAQPITAATKDRPAIGPATVVGFEYGEAEAHTAPVDSLTIGNGPLPTATEGRKLKRQKLATVATMGALEDYVRATVPDPNDPDFESKLEAKLGKGFAVTDGEGRGQANGTATPAATTIGSLRRTIHQMIDMAATTTAQKPAAATGANATGVKGLGTGGAGSRFEGDGRDSKRVVYPHAYSADVPQNLELVTCELSPYGIRDEAEPTDDDWTIHPMCPVFFKSHDQTVFDPAMHKVMEAEKSGVPRIYANYNFRKYSVDNDKDNYNGFAGVALHDGLQAAKLTKEHPSRRSLAVAFGGVVNLSCDRYTQDLCDFGDDIWITYNLNPAKENLHSVAHMVTKEGSQVPRYHPYAPNTALKDVDVATNVKGGECIGRYVGPISKHGGIRVVLHPHTRFFRGPRVAAPLPPTRTSSLP